jgi:hypothetical protein
MYILPENNIYTRFAYDKRELGPAHDVCKKNANQRTFSKSYRLLYANLDQCAVHDSYLHGLPGPTEAVHMPTNRHVFAYDLRGNL